MNWIDTETALPHHLQEVYVKCDDLVGLAVFDSARTRFILPNGAQYAMNHRVYWCALDPKTPAVGWQTQ